MLKQSAHHRVVARQRFAVQQQPTALIGIGHHGRMLHQCIVHLRHHVHGHGMVSLFQPLERFGVSRSIQGPREQYLRLPFGCRYERHETGLTKFQAPRRIVFSTFGCGHLAAHCIDGEASIDLTGRHVHPVSERRKRQRHTLRCIEARSPFRFVEQYAADRDAVERHFAEPHVLDGWQFRVVALDRESHLHGGHFQALDDPARLPGELAPEELERGLCIGDGGLKGRAVVVGRVDDLLGHGVHPCECALMTRSIKVI